MAHAAVCGLTRSLLKLSHWARFGYSLRFQSELANGIAVIGQKGASAREVGEQDLLFLVAHLRSHDRIRFTSLTKTSLVEEEAIEKAMKHVTKETKCDVVSARSDERRPADVSHPVSVQAPVEASGGGRDLICSCASSRTGFLRSQTASPISCRCPSLCFPAL